MGCYAQLRIRLSYYERLRASNFDDAKTWGAPFELPGVSTNAQKLTIVTKHPDIINEVPSDSYTIFKRVTLPTRR